VIKGARSQRVFASSNIEHPTSGIEHPSYAMSTLYIFAGLPGTGKTALARRLAQQVHAAYLRIDTIEQGLRDLCGVNVQGEGYRLSYRIAADNLKLGIDVVADSCNPIELTRHEWEHVAQEAAAAVINIEVVCSNAREHRERIESRVSDLPGLTLPTWEQVEERDYRPWSKERLIIDTAGRSEAQSAEALFIALGCYRGHPQSAPNIS
jgi:predicted kinase